MDIRISPAKTVRILLTTLLLALLSLPGAGAEEDVWQAVFNFQMHMAQKGNLAAQEKVAEMYEEGRGVEQDYALAEYWYRKAAAQGHQSAALKLKGLPDRVKSAKAARAREKEAQARRQKLARQRAAEEKAAREKVRQEKARREKLAAERERAARAKALQEQRAAEKRKAAQALRQRRAAMEKARQEQLQAKRASQTPLPTTPAVKPPPAPAHEDAHMTDREPAQTFKADPCKSKAARFMSTCKNK